MTGQRYDERAARGARSQSLFRDVNERVREINVAFSAALPLAEWICEWRLGQPREDHNVGAQPNGNGRASRGRRERLQL